MGNGHYCGEAAPLTEKHIFIGHPNYVVAACQAGRRMAASLGFSISEQTAVATAISELAYNIVKYAGCGEIILRAVDGGAAPGIEIVASDHGPGIPDIELAMQDGFSTGGSLGLGLPGAKRLMDEFEISSQVGCGTSVRVKKWKR